MLYIDVFRDFRTNGFGGGNSTSVRADAQSAGRHGTPGAPVGRAGPGALSRENRKVRFGHWQARAFAVIDAYAAGGTPEEVFQRLASIPKPPPRK